MEVRSIKISEGSLGRSKNHCKSLPAPLCPAVLPKKSHFSKLTLNSNKKENKTISFVLSCILRNTLTVCLYQS